MSYYDEQFNNLNEDEKDAILEFVNTITEGDVWVIVKEMDMFPSDILRLCKALEKFQEG